MTESLQVGAGMIREWSAKGGGITLRSQSQPHSSTSVGLSQNIPRRAMDLNFDYNKFTW